MANGPRREHSPVSSGGGGSYGDDTIVAMVAERVGVGRSTPILMIEVAVSIAEEMVDEASRKAREGSKPGGGSMKRETGELWQILEMPGSFSNHFEKPRFTSASTITTLGAV